MERTREPVITKRFILEHTEDDEIDLSLCNLSKVPVKELAQVPRGVKLDLSQNKLAQLPENFVTLKHIAELDLSKNELFELPHNFGGLIHLQRLDLYGNKLVTLPLSFSQLKRLKWLDVRNNSFEEELARMAGDCLSDEECKQCAVNVVKFLRERSANEERRRQKDLERQRELQRRQQQQNEEKLQAARQRKAVEKQRRKEEWERRKAEEVQQNGEQAKHVSKVSSFVGETKKSSHAKRSWIGCLCTFILTTLALVLVVGALLTFIDNPWQREMQSALADIKKILMPTPS